ncbi:MAG TPA: ATP-binding protein [Anaerolineales bacterium]|nr:ATP-binding protein [Anaerolineales bacterium]
MEIKSLPKILYIEDMPDSRALVRRLLERRYIVLESGDPISGIELAKDTLPDLVLLDINLPDMNGREAAARLKNIVPRAPLVAITADNTPGAREKALAAGFVGFITKPLDPDAFQDQVEGYLRGNREELPNPDAYQSMYQTELAEHLEAKIRSLGRALERNQFLQQQNQHIIDALTRRQSILEASARVSHDITSILNLDDLLRTTVTNIFDEFNLYYSGIFLLSEDQQFLKLRAGHGIPGTKLLVNNFIIPVDDQSLIGRAAFERMACMSSQDGTEAAKRLNQMHMPGTRFAMALPLVFKGDLLGVLSVQSTETGAFAEEDMTALQSLADQIAIAIHNARLLHRLESANQELMRSKTFEAIASATGEAIHWVGNKAAPMAGSVRRVRQDLLNLVAVFHSVFIEKRDVDGRLQGIINNLFIEAGTQGVEYDQIMKDLLNDTKLNLYEMVSLNSMLEDLAIIENSANTILDIKEDLIGPARKRTAIAFSPVDELTRIISEMNVSKNMVSTIWPSEHTLLAWGDTRQFNQIFANLIKNACEALEGCPRPLIHISVQEDRMANFIRICVSDNGPGIPPEIQEKIWVPFFTTKGRHGGTGLGLPACMENVRQNGGKIWLESQTGRGAAFHVLWPATPAIRLEEV